MAISFRETSKETKTNVLWFCTYLKEQPLLSSSEALVSQLREVNTLVNQVTWDSGMPQREWGMESLRPLLHIPLGCSWELCDLVSPEGSGVGLVEAQMQGLCDLLAGE